MYQTPPMAIYTPMVSHTQSPYSLSRQHHHNIARITNCGGRSACHCSSACRRFRFARDHFPHLMIVLECPCHMQRRRCVWHQHPPLCLHPCRLLSVLNPLSGSATLADHIIPSFGKTCLALVPLGFPAPSPARLLLSHLTTTTRHVLRNPWTVGSVCQCSSARIRGQCRWF